jgi:1-deoxy-D-xylulose-5-phosphate reductoisomerase
MKDSNKIITILGSTGSIGVQTLQVLDALGEGCSVGYLTTNSNIDLLIEQVKKYKPEGIVISEEKAFNEFKNKFSFSGSILKGKDGICEAASFAGNDLVVSALVGFSGVLPTLSAIKAGKDVALANKETLVSAGSIITKTVEDNNVRLIAVDSEHSAVLQCIIGEERDSIEKIILTASGGPFRNTDINDFEKITAAQALAHPNWSMGNKITIDSATMMNKGFEIIEAFWLFGVNKQQIEVLIHPQSIVHSLVQFIDGSVKAQLGLPDMRLPISYALDYPHRHNYDFPRLDLAKIGSLTFEKPDTEKFRCLALAYYALESGGTATAILNASNEIAVDAFLKNKISFNGIAECVEKALNSIPVQKQPGLDEIIFADNETRVRTKELIKKMRK